MPTDWDALEWRRTRHEGIFLHRILTDERSGDTVVLIRMEPGSVYPAHRHVGEERLLVLQGGYRDDRGEYRAGRSVVHPAGSRHRPVALEGETTILLARALGGIELLPPEGTGGGPSSAPEPGR